MNPFREPRETTVASRAAEPGFSDPRLRRPPAPRRPSPVIDAWRRRAPLEWERLQRAGSVWIARQLPVRAVEPPATAPRPHATPRRKAAARSTGRILARTMLLTTGILLLLAGAQPVHLAWQSRHWQPVEGRIVASAMHTATEETTGLDRLFHRIRFAYEYPAQGRRMQAGRIEFGPGDGRFLSQGFAERMLRRYPVDKEVRILVNPANPRETVLETTPPMDGTLLPVTLGLFCLFVRHFHLHDP